MTDMQIKNRWLAVFALATALISSAAGVMASSAGAEPPPQTDVMFLFDTSESMSPALKEAAQQTEKTMEQIESKLVDVQYGVSEVRDYGGSLYDQKHPGDRPWRLDTSITSNKEAVMSTIRGLKSEGGGDPPEAYGRALWEITTNPNVGWRPGAKHLVVLIADSVPHDNNLDDGIPQSAWIEPAPWSTDEELRDPAGIPGSNVTGETNLDWQHVLEVLGQDHVSLQVVVYHPETGITPYWENWAARTQGESVPAESGQLGSQITTLLEAHGNRLCPQAHGSTGRMLLASLKCAAGVRANALVCQRKVSISKLLRQLLATGVAARNSTNTAVVQLLDAIKGASFLRHPPLGFGTSDDLLRKLERSGTALHLMKLLPGIAKAVHRHSFNRIVRHLIGLPGAKHCATGLINQVK